MHVLIVNFRLADQDFAAYQQQCEQFAPAFAAIPGLIIKQWLANEATNTYGGVYFFKDKQSLEDYLEGELFGLLAANNNFTDVTVKSFGTIEQAGAITGGTIFATAA